MLLHPIILMRLEIHTVVLGGPSGHGSVQKSPSAITGFELV